MIRILADEDFKGRIIAGVLRQNPTFDIVTVRGVGLAGAPDPVVLEWAAREGRVLLTHDAGTMPAHAYARIRIGLPEPGLFVVPQSLPVGHAIEDILLIAELGLPNEWNGQVRYYLCDRPPPRIPVERVPRHLEDNDRADLFAAFPELTEEDVRACLAFARAAIERRHHDPVRVGDATG